MSKLYHLFADFNSHTNDNTANILRNRLKMILFSVSHDEQVIFFNIGFEHFRICSSHQNFSFCKISMLISLYYGTCNCLGNSSVLCLRSWQQITVRCIHISLSNITDCDQTFQLSFSVSDRKRYDTFLHHQIPCIFQGHTLISFRTHTDIHIFYLCSNVRQISRRLHAETI